MVVNSIKHNLILMVMVLRGFYGSQNRFSYTTKSPGSLQYSKERLLSKLQNFQYGKGYKRALFPLRITKRANKALTELSSLLWP